MPIVTSLLDVDFYKFTMGQVVFRHFRDVNVVLRLQCRTPGADLVAFVDEDELRAELEAARELRLNNTELHYLRGTNEYGERMFSEDYLQFLRDLRLPQFFLSYHQGQMKLDFVGPWWQVMMWETIALSIINELYYRGMANSYAPSGFEQETMNAGGILALSEKILYLRQHPELTFSDFGTRRRFSKAWQEYVVGTLADELPKQFLGTSNVYLAMQHGLVPMGTSAHELFMVGAGVAKQDDDAIRESHNQMLLTWWATYGRGLSVALTDTFGSDFFFRDWAKRPEQAAAWKGVRHDSGDPFEFGERVIQFYKSLGIDPNDKVIVFSDSLTAERMIELHERFAGRIRTTFGWGTNLTNDICLPRLSLVIKPVVANGIGLVKLSDNLNKAVGTDADIARYRRIFDHGHNNKEECRS